MNYKNKIGEIDIVALDKNVTVFVEVKRRSTLAFGRPCGAYTCPGKLPLVEVIRKGKSAVREAQRK